MNGREWIGRLERYRSDRARMEYLRKFIPLMEKKLAILRREAFASLGARPDMAAAPGSGHADPTAMMGVRAAEDALDADMRACSQQLKRLRQEHSVLSARLSMTDCLLSLLGEEERFLVTERYIGHTRWTRLPDRYRERFGEYYSETTLRRRLRQAVEDLSRVTREAG